MGLMNRLVGYVRQRGQCSQKEDEAQSADEMNSSGIAVERSHDAQESASF